MNKVFSVDPTTKTNINEYHLDSDHDVDLKIKKATGAFEKWKKLDHTTRANFLKNVEKKILDSKEAIALTITGEIGMPISQSLGEVDKGISLIREIIKNGPGQLAPRSVPEAKSRVEYSPMGVCLSVAPWNFPFYLALRSILPNVMAGNAVLLKHSVTCQGVAKLIENCFKVDGIPQGLVTNLVIRGSVAESLLSRREVKLATLIGSERAGRSFAAAAGKNLKKVVLELGGNDSLVVFADADLAAAAKGAAESRLRNCGQACNAAKRYLVHSSVKDKFVELLKMEFDKFKPGNPLSKETQLGPIATEEAVNTFIAQCAVLDRHAKLLHEVKFDGWSAEQAHYANGCWVTPKLYELVDRNYEESEIFGPAAVLETFDSITEGSEKVNWSRYGLGCSVWTSSKETFEEFKQLVEVGNIFHNSIVRSHVGLPYGGVKDSGFGRELGEEGLKEVCNVKVIFVG